MVKKTVKLQRGKHRVPSCFEQMIEEFEEVDGIQKVIAKDFHHVKHPEMGSCKIKGYDIPVNALKVMAIDEGFKLNLYVYIDPKLRRYVEEYIQNYRN